MPTTQDKRVNAELRDPARSGGRFVCETDREEHEAAAHNHEPDVATNNISPPTIDYRPADIAHDSF
jgi:hypothetical protein